MKGKIMDVIIFGVGSTWKKEKNYLSKDMNIVGYMDNYANDSEIIRPGDLIKGGYSFDKILICVVFEHRFNMVNQLLDLGIPKEKIGFIKAHWCGSEKCEELIKNETDGFGSRCLPLDEQDIENKKCIYCGKEAKHYVVWGKAY